MRIVDIDHGGREWGIECELLVFGRIEWIIVCYLHINHHVRGEDLLDQLVHHDLSNRVKTMTKSRQIQQRFGPYHLTPSQHSVFLASKYGNYRVKSALTVVGRTIPLVFFVLHSLSCTASLLVIRFATST